MSSSAAAMRPESRPRFWRRKGGEGGEGGGCDTAFTGFTIFPSHWRANCLATSAG